MRRDPIKIVAYDPDWPTLFAGERNRLAPVLAPWLVEPIEHIGSTAVPAFRDHLRAHPAASAEYGRIKTELASRDDRDRTAYRAGKAPFIRGVLDGALR